mmetsp:Transcript_9440/g.19345  ORF Transcript_9440/g.19345 Transcript_9440/m.19345 type:complete len:90 (+) Transcript_9440:154-423(+)
MSSEFRKRQLVQSDQGELQPISGTQVNLVSLWTTWSRCTHLAQVGEGNTVEILRTVETLVGGNGCFFRIIPVLAPFLCLLSDVWVILLL